MSLPPAYWPPSGDLNVESLSARYSADGPKVLHDISFHVKSGERVGIGEQFVSSTLRANGSDFYILVGRTGSGKVIQL